MFKALDKTANLLLYYQCALAISAVFTFFTNLDLFSFTQGLSPSSTILTIVFGIASTPLLFSFGSRIKYLPLSVIAWCAGYVLIALISFSLNLPDESALQELRRRILSVIFMLIMLLIFSKYYFVQIWARRAIFLSVFMAIFTIIYNFVDPLAFKLNTLDYKDFGAYLDDSGRPAGFYIDPNKAGLALIFGMVFNTGLLPPKYRVPWVLIIGLNVLLTLSRGATLSWLVIVVMMTIRRTIPRSQLLYWVIGIGTMGVCLGTGALLNPNNLQELGLNKTVIERLEWFKDPSKREDAADARLEVAEIAWQLFAKHPFFGNGLGSTLNLSIGISAHNMYLLYMADYGIIGLFIIPLLVYGVTHNARGETKYLGWYFAALILLWCLFSHTVLDDRFIIIMFSLMAAMNATSQQEQKSQVGV